MKSLRAHSHSLIGVIAVIASMSIVVSGCTAFGPDTSPSVERISETPSKSEIHDFARTLPQDSVLAAESIVNAIFGTDTARAAAATAEALAISGIALTNDNTDIIAATDFVYADYLVPASFVPSLANSMRSGMFYDADNVSSLFQGLGLTETPATADVLSATMRQWGKDATNPAQVQAAGNIVRALAAHAGRLPIAGVAPQFDMVQLLLLFVQLTGTLYSYSPHTPSASGATAELAGYHDQKSAPQNSQKICADIMKKLEEKGEKLKRQLEGTATDTIISKGIPWGIEHLMKDGPIKAIASKAGEEFAAVMEKLGTAVSVLQQALTTLLLMSGVQLDLSNDMNSETHFRHEHNNHSLNVTVTATVTFDSSLDQDKLACYNLLGIDAPANGAISGEDSKGKWNGWQVTWSYGEEIAPNNYYGSVPHGDVLRPQKSSLRAKAFTHLDKNGQASLESMTRTERDLPNTGEVHTVVADVVAKVDQVKEINPLDMISLGGGVLVVAAMAIQAINLPSARQPITVTYHGQDTYVIKGHESMNIMMLSRMDFDADYYSCDGLDGPWKGSSGYAVDSGALGQLGTSMGYEGPLKGNFTDDSTTFELDKKSTAPQQVLIGPDKFGLEITIKNPPKRGEHLDGYLGEGTWLMPGSGMNGSTFANQMGGLLGSGGLTYEVRGVPEDSRCPGPKFEDNTWDE